MSNRDEVADLADRIRERQRRGEDFELEFMAFTDDERDEFMAFTDDERDEFMALMEQRRGHGEEVLEALVENVLILRLLFAWREGAITALEFAERVGGAVPDPLAEQPD